MIDEILGEAETLKNMAEVKGNVQTDSHYSKCSKKRFIPMKETVVGDRKVTEEVIAKAG